MAGMGLVLVSPRQGWVRRRARPIFERELRQPGESTRRVLERGRALRAAGLEPQLHRPPTAVNVFWVDADERRFAFRYDAANGKALFLRSLAGRGVDGAAAETIDQPPLDAAEALALLDEAPPPLSANVVTRPVLQDAILPTVAQIVGPGEAAYLAQVEAAYELFDVFVPVRYPRPQALLLEPRVARHLERYGLDAVEAAECDAEALTERVVRRDLESGDLGELTALRREQLEALDRLAARLAKPGSAAEGAFRRLRQAMEKGYDTVAERLLYQHQQDQQHVSQAMATVAASLRPAGAPQERRLNPLVPFAVNYSPAWTAALAARLAIDPSAPMQVIAMSALAADTASVE